MPPKKKIPSGEKKKSKTTAPAKGASVKPRSKPQPKPASQSTGGRSPLYALAIMIILAVIAFAGERFYDKIFKNAGQSSPLKNNNAEKPSKTKEVRNPINEKDKDKDKDKDKEKDKKDVSDEKEISKSVKLYLLLYDEKTERVVLSTVVRKIEGDQFIEKTMHALMRGPTGIEKGRGILTAIESDTKIRNITLKNKTLEIDFNSSISRGAGGGIILNRIDQIVYTATQFTEVDAVVIKINGKTASALGSDGVSIIGPLRRRE